MIIINISYIINRLSLKFNISNIIYATYDIRITVNLIKKLHQIIIVIIVMYIIIFIINRSTGGKL